MTELTIDVHKSMWVSANSRLHWAALAKRKKHIRQLAHYLTRQQRLTVPTPCFIVATIGYLTTGRADVENASVAVKAAIDGCVSGGALEDDNSEHVVSVQFERGPKSPVKDHYRIHLKFIDQRITF